MRHRRARAALGEYLELVDQAERGDEPQSRPVAKADSRPPTRVAGPCVGEQHEPHSGGVHEREPAEVHDQQLRVRLLGLLDALLGRVEGRDVELAVEDDLHGHDAASEGPRTSAVMMPPPRDHARRRS
jgi:hypothetical protein